MHRYQVEAVSKTIGGYHYTYAVRGDDQRVLRVPSREAQIAAVQALCNTLTTDFLKVPERILKLIPPPALGYSRDRESFKTYSSPAFDPLAVAESSAANTIRFLIHPERLARLVIQQEMNPENLSPNELLEMVFEACSSTDNAYERMVGKVYLNRLLELASSDDISPEVTGIVYAHINEMLKYAEKGKLYNSPTAEEKAHFSYLERQIKLFEQNPTTFKPVKSPSMPDGSPIGCGGFHD
jgi:hypothetical protein